jgi:hypothetical protein
MSFIAIQVTGLFGVQGHQFVNLATSWQRDVCPESSQPWLPLRLQRRGQGEIRPKPYL